jgi:2-hydroxy-6-oxonona-2,4-dienedioate hydrolase
MNDLPTYAEDMPLAGEGAEDCIERILATGSRKTTPCGEGEMVWHVWGEGNAVPVILFHGNFGSWPHWIRNIPILSQRYALYVPDVPGFGDSDLPPEPYSIEGLVEITLEGFDALTSPDTRFHVTGFSFGSTMTGFTAMAAGDRVLSVSLCGGSRLVGMSDLQRPFINWRKAKTDDERMAAHRNNLGVAMLHGIEAVDDLAVAIQDRIATRCRIKPREFLDPAALLPALTHVKVPMLTLWGVHDPYYPFMNEKWDETIGANNIPLKRIDIEDASHWTIYERPDVMNRHLLDWYAENDPA